MTSDIRHTPISTHIYGLYDPEGSGITFYKSAAERDKAAEDAIQKYEAFGIWYQGVTGIFAFMATHCATCIDVARPVGETRYEKEGRYEADEYWPNTDCDYKKWNYALKPFPEDTADDGAPMTATVSERSPECLDAWPECWSGGYDPRCCRFPKSCSCDLRPANALPTPEATNG